LLLEALEEGEIRSWRSAAVLYERGLRVLSVARRFEDAVEVMRTWTWYALTEREAGEMAERRREEVLEKVWDRYVWCLVEAGRFEEARLQAGAFYGRFRPKLPVSGLYLARALSARLRFEESAAAAGELLEVYPDEVSVRGQYWLALLRSGQEKKALEEGRNWAVNAEGAQQKVVEHLYVTLAWQAGRYEEVLAWLEELLKERQGDKGLWDLRVKTCLMAGRLEEAEAVVGEYAGGGGDEFGVLNMWLEVDIAQGECSRALGRLEETAGKLEEEALEGYRRELLANCGELAKAAERLVRQVEAGEADLESRLEYAGYLEQLGRREEGLAILEGLLAEMPEEAGMQNNVGFTLVEAGREARRARVLLEASLWAEPGSAATLDSMGWLDYKEGEFERALGYILQAAGRTGGVDPEMYDHLGDVSWRLGREEEAVRYWRLALEEVTRRVVFDRKLEGRKGELERKLEEAASGGEAETAGLFGGS
jgi:tetratricopeptide (TPR) repeat protein